MINVVCCGRMNAFSPTIERRRKELGLESQVYFLGYVEPIEMRVLYRKAKCLVFPSRFEGWGLPVVEAFEEGLAVTCSNAASLPEVAGDAALLFSPDDLSEFADSLARVWTDARLRETLIDRGHALSRSLSWERTARIFRAHYRRLGGREITSEDADLLAESQR
jgi:glycosyltransferase involved in cell wall biosynthesis